MRERGVGVNKKSHKLPALAKSSIPLSTNNLWRQRPHLNPWYDMYLYEVICFLKSFDWANENRHIEMLATGDIDS